MLDYTHDDFADGTRGYDVILDIAGNTPIRRLRRALGPRGRVVIVGGETGAPLAGGLGRPIWGALTSPFRRQKVVMFLSRESGADLAPITDLIESGRVMPVLDTTFPLEKAADAMAHLESGRARGKIAISVKDGSA